MACTICLKSFGFFNKEYGCPVCKYSFCSGCLKYKLVRDGNKLNVCLRCSKLATTAGPSERKTELKPTVVEQHSEEALSSQMAQNVVQVPSRSEPEPEPEPIPNDDELIRSKLNALKEKNLNETGTDLACSTSGADGNIDIEKRLAALKGVEYKDYRNAAQRFMATPDDRTEEQKVQDLIGQFAGEAKLDHVMDSQRLEQDEELMKRLNALKEFPHGSSGAALPPGPAALPGNDSDDSVNDEEMARKLAERFAEEGKIAAKSTPDDSEDEILSPSKPAADDEEELPWCTICNEDAVLRCRGCDNDLYCKACYKEFHYDEDPREHKTEPFKPKTKKNK